MSATKNKDLTTGHKAVISKNVSIATAERNGLFDAMADSITFAVALYAVIYTEVFVRSGVNSKEYATLRGGEYFGLLSKSDSPFYYGGDMTNYPSSAYLGQAFALQYMHDDNRLKEYRATNTSPRIKDYVQWLAIMFGTAIGSHCALARSADKTLAKWTLTAATKADINKGKAYHSAVLKSEVRDNQKTVTLPKAISDAIAEGKTSNMADRRKFAAVYDMSTWSQTELALNIRSAVAQYMLNAAVKKGSTQKATASK